jgi:hypothetical protein
MADLNKKLRDLHQDVHDAIDHVVHLQEQLKEIAIKSVNKSKLDYVQHLLKIQEKKGNL